MHTVGVVITRFVDPHQPGFVECVLTDAWGREWTFVEKVPVVSAAALDEHSPYPQPAAIACEVVRRWRDAAGREWATVDTERPWGVESTAGQTRFDVLAEQAVQPHTERESRIWHACLDRPLSHRRFFLLHHSERGTWATLVGFR